MPAATKITPEHKFCMMFSLLLLNLPPEDGTGKKVAMILLSNPASVTAAMRRVHLPVIWLKVVSMRLRT